MWGARICALVQADLRDEKISRASALRGYGLGDRYINS
jgi:hypothetical protein